MKKKAQTHRFDFYFPKCVEMRASRRGGVFITFEDGAFFSMAPEEALRMGSDLIRHARSAARQNCKILALPEDLR